MWQWTVAGLALAGLAIQLLVGWAQAASAVAAAAAAAGRVLAPVLRWIWLPLLAGIVMWRGRHAWRALRQGATKLWHRAHHPGLVAPIGLEMLLLAGLVAAAVFVLPLVLVPAAVTTPEEQALVDLRNNVRGTLIQAAGGLLLVLAAVAAWRQLRIHREELHIAREGQITERYTRAVDQLGAAGDDGQEKIDVQLGGIYALERLAHDSPDDQATIVEVLTAFVRQRATTVTPRTEAPEDETDGPATVDTLQARLPTVQAALRVLGRMPRPAHVHLELPNVNIRRADLRDADLTEAYLAGADLTDARLYRADLTRAHLTGANLTRARLYRADLTRAHLTGANLTDATLPEANLTRAHLTGANLARATLWDADLTGANLQRAVLARVDLQGADLTGVDLRGADLTGAKWDANLTGVRADDDTKWPAGFDPAAADVTTDDAPQ